MTTLAHLTRLAARAAHRKDALLIERGLGYWITTDDEYVPTPPRVAHADLVREWFDEDRTLSEADRDDLTRDANLFAIQRGWTRVRIYPADRVVHVDYGEGRQPAHEPLLNALLDQIGLTGYRVKYTDEDGNYVSS
jgi:hypothetical protein